MFKLRVSKQCISCGICMDVCKPRAIAMKFYKGQGVEGDQLTYLHFHGNSNSEIAPEKMMVFPFLVFPERCNGSMVCVNQCPTGALELFPQ